MCKPNLSLLRRQNDFGCASLCGHFLKRPVRAVGLLFHAKEQEFRAVRRPPRPHEIRRVAARCDHSRITAIVSADADDLDAAGRSELMIEKTLIVGGKIGKDVDAVDYLPWRSAEQRHAEDG